MNDLRQRHEPIRSRAYLDGAKEARCTFQIPGVCTGGPCVSCHLVNETAGMALKADDLHVADGCDACHAKMDGRLGAPLSPIDWLSYAFRGLTRTLRVRHAQALLRIDDDAPMKREAPARKPKSQRAKIAHRETDWPSKPIPQRPSPWSNPRTVGKI